MALDYTPKRFAIHAVYNVLLRNTATTDMIAYLDDLKTSSLVNELVLVYPTGGCGNTYIGGAFGHSRRARIEAQKATWTTDIAALQVGTTVVTGSNTDAIQYDVLTITDNAATPTFTALGTLGAEISFANTVNSDGTYDVALTQAALVTATEFTYTPGTNLITTSGLADGTKIAIAYEFNTGTSAQTITVAVGDVPSTALVTAYGIVKDLYTNLEYKMQINGTVQIDPNWSWALTADGEPSVEDFKMEFVRACGTTTLYEIIVYNEDDAALL